MPACCERHSFDEAQTNCRRCGGWFCADCLVYPAGMGAYCVPCALAAAGVRSAPKRAFR